MSQSVVSSAAPRSRKLDGAGDDGGSFGDSTAALDLDAALSGLGAGGSLSGLGDSGTRDSGTRDWRPDS